MNSVGYGAWKGVLLWERVAALTGGKKISFTAQQRRRLAEAGKLPTPEERCKCCLLVKPATILAWLRQLAAAHQDPETARGSPRMAREAAREASAALPWLGARWAFPSESPVDWAMVRHATIESDFVVPTAAP
jgi:hypothetical protein